MEKKEIYIAMYSDNGIPCSVACFDSKELLEEYAYDFYQEEDEKAEEFLNEWYVSDTTGDEHRILCATLNDLGEE